MTKPETSDNLDGGDIDIIVHKFPCVACGETIKLQIDPEHRPLTGEIECPHCGDTSWRWNDANS